VKLLLSSLPYFFLKRFVLVPFALGNSALALSENYFGFTYYTLCHVLSYLLIPALSISGKPFLKTDIDETNSAYSLM